MRFERWVGIRVCESFQVIDRIGWDCFKYNVQGLESFMWVEFYDLINVFKKQFWLLGGEWGVRAGGCREIRLVAVKVEGQMRFWVDFDGGVMGGVVGGGVVDGLDMKDEIKDSVKVNFKVFDQGYWKNGVVMF